MPDAVQDLLQGPLNIINLGVADFGEALEAQGLSVLAVDWELPAGGDKEMIALLDLLL